MTCLNGTWANSGTCTVHTAGNGQSISIATREADGSGLTATIFGDVRNVITRCGRRSDPLTSDLEGRLTMAKRECPRCNGTGSCPTCNGKGSGYFGQPFFASKCKNCEGGDCPRCDGRGVVYD